MARGRIFSSRRMFSTRRSAFVEPSKQSGPLGVLLGLSAAAIIIFVIGIFVGRAMPHQAVSPFALGEPVAPFVAGTGQEPAAQEPAAYDPLDATADLDGPEAPSSDGSAGVPGSPDVLETPDAANSSGAAAADALSTPSLTEPVTATEH